MTAPTDVIDWVRVRAEDRWQTANIRDVRTHGVEASASRAWTSGFARVEYTWLRSDAPSLTMLSKYVADYAPHSLAISGSVRLKGSAWLGARADCKEKVDGRGYCGVDARVSRPFGRVELFVEVTNLLNARYQEIAGVDMAPRWVAAGLRVVP